MTAQEPSIVVEVVRLRCRHNERLGQARVVEGPAYVQAHHTAIEFGALCSGLASTGHAFAVRIIEQEISPLEYGLGDT